MTAEKIALAFFAYISLAACVFQLSGRDLVIIMTLNTLTFATLMALAIAIAPRGLLPPHTCFPRC